LLIQYPSNNRECVLLSKKNIGMHAFNNFYFHCPNCNAVLEGKTLEMLGMNFTELYSDGKMLCDDFLTEPQWLVCCPSCSHIFWRSKNQDDHIPETEISDYGSIYPYSSWYLFGANMHQTAGKKALIRRLEKFLLLLRPLSPEQELYLRKSLLWAINDLVRESQAIGFLALLQGKIGFCSWRQNRKTYLTEKFIFLSYSKAYNDNIKRLIELVRSFPDKEADKVYLAELYRLKGNFSKSREVLDKLNRATHYAHQIRMRVNRKNPAVFKVAG